MHLAPRRRERVALVLRRKIEIDERRVRDQEDDRDDDELEAERVPEPRDSEFSGRRDVEALLGAVIRRASVSAFAPRLATRATTA
jgi:hypothetical protein